MAVLYFFNAATGKWEPISSGGGGGTPGPQGPAGPAGKDGKDGESVAVLVQDSQPASARPGTVWISNS